MTHGSLFSGIGGFDLAAQWMGWQNVFHCENAKFPKQILRQHFPDAISYDDITTTDFTVHRGGVDVLTGGFPCQPFSLAGKRKGTADARHLWPEMLRAITEISPRYVVGENVFGLVNWSGGMVFDQIQAALEAAGYQVASFILPACGVGAPHRRDRVWIVAHCARNGRCARRCNSNGQNEDASVRTDLFVQPDRFSEVGSASKPNRVHMENGQYEQICMEQEDGRQSSTGFKHDSLPTDWSNWPSEPPVRGGNYGLSRRLDRIKALGNAIVPQVALQIFKAIEQYEHAQNLPHLRTRV